MNRFRMPAGLVLTALLASSAAPLSAQALREVTPQPAPAAAPKTELEQQLAKVRQPAPIEELAAKFAAEKDWEKLQHATQRLTELRPHNGNYRLTLAATYALQDKKREAYDSLVRLQNAGYAYEIKDDPRFEKVRGTEVWDFLVQGFEANAKEFGSGKVAYELPAGDLLVETIGWDPVRKQLLAGSAREGKVFRVAKNGALEDYITADAKNGLWAVMDVAVDAPRDALWIASSAIPHFKRIPKTDYGRAAVFRFKLSTGEFVERFEVPIDARTHILSSITVSPKGDVFAADGVLRQLWKVEGGKLRLAIAENPRLTSIRGIAASDTALYFADYELGVFGIDLKTGEPFELRFPPNISLYSVDGLSWSDGHLVVVQAGFPPKRVMRLDLAEDGRSIAKHQGLEVNRAKFGTPTRGTVAGDTYYFIANTQKGKYDSYGLLRTGAQLEPVRIYATDLKLGLGLPGTVMPAPKQD